MIRFFPLCLIFLLLNVGFNTANLTNWTILLGDVQKSHQEVGFENSHQQYETLQEGGKMLSELTPKKSRTISYFLILIFVGIAFSIGLFSLIAFSFNKRTEFLFYTLYLVTLIVYLGKLPLIWEGVLQSSNSIMSSRLDTVLQILASIFYYLFIQSFLNLKQELPKANKVLNISVVILGILFMSELFLYVVGNQSAVVMSLTQRMILVSALFLILVVLILARLRTVLVYTLLVGSSILVLGSLLFSLYANIDYLVLGLILEVLIFALAILYKIKLINDERERVRLEALESKNRALRAQINPHFIFNALGSIQNLVTRDNKKASLEYLTKFGRLTRNILDGSMNTHVLLDEEIKMTKDYLELESLRFSDGFKYLIKVEEDIDPREIEVPMLFVQPFVENAIIHGLLLKTEGERLLEIKFKKNEGFLVCVVEDNGVGRKRSAEIKSKPYKKKSHGIEVTSQRFGHDDSVKIIDLFDDGEMRQAPRSF